MEQNENIQPRETITFSYTKESFRALYKAFEKNSLNVYLKAMVFLFAIAALLFLSELTVAGIVVAVLPVVLFALFLFTTVKARKNEKMQLPTIENRLYTYALYDDHLAITVKTENEDCKNYVILNTKVNATLLDNFFVFYHQKRTFAIPMSLLKQDSAFFSLKRKEPKKPFSFPSRPKKTPLERLALVLFIASIASIWGALLVMGLLSSINYNFVENTWTFFLFLPIPIASIIVGILCNVKGIKNRKNIIAGLIMSALLSIYGSFTFIFADVFDDSYTYVTNAETTTGVDLPDEGEARTTVENAIYDPHRTILYYWTDVYFTDKQVADFESRLDSESVWKTEKSNSILGLIPSPVFHLTNADHFFLFNDTLDSFNSAPSRNGTYRFILVEYNAQDNRMRITEYDLTYVQ